MSLSTHRPSPPTHSRKESGAGTDPSPRHEPHDPWLFSEDSFILRLPSRQQLKLLVLQELKARESLNEFVIKLASRLKLDGPTILCATVLLNRYYMRVPLLLSKYFVASAAIVISGKLNDTYRSPDKVALHGAVLKNPVPGQLVDEHCDLFWRWRDQILYREELLLKTLNFDLAFTLPYSIRDLLQEQADPDHLLFTEKKPHILKNALALIEMLSLLPILIAYDVNTLFGAALVVIILEGRKIFGNDTLMLPPNYLHLRLRTSSNKCFDCYRYIMRLIKYSLCDPKIASNKAAFKRLRPIPQQTFLKAANDSESAEQVNGVKEKGYTNGESISMTRIADYPDKGNGNDDSQQKSTIKASENDNDSKNYTGNTTVNNSKRPDDESETSPTLEDDEKRDANNASSGPKDSTLEAKNLTNDGKARNEVVTPLNNVKSVADPASTAATGHELQTIQGTTEGIKRPACDENLEGNVHKLQRCENGTPKSSPDGDSEPQATAVDPNASSLHTEVPTDNS